MTKPEFMERPNRLIGRLRGGCDLTIQEEFEVYLYIKFLESELKKDKSEYTKILELFKEFNN